MWTLPESQNRVIAECLEIKNSFLAVNQICRFAATKWKSSRNLAVGCHSASHGIRTFQNPRTLNKNGGKICSFAVNEIKDLQMHHVALGFKVYDRSRLPDFLCLISSLKNKSRRCYCAEGTEVQKYILEVLIALRLKNQRWLEWLALKACPSDHSNKRIVK